MARSGNVNVTVTVETGGDRRAASRRCFRYADGWVLAALLVALCGLFGWADPFDCMVIAMGSLVSSSVWAAAGVVLDPSKASR